MRRKNVKRDAAKLQGHRQQPNRLLRSKAAAKGTSKQHRRAILRPAVSPQNPGKKVTKSSSNAPASKNHTKRQSAISKAASPAIRAAARRTRQQTPVEIRRTEVRPADPLVTPAKKPATRNSAKDISRPVEQDRLVLTARDPFWLHAHWDITLHSIQRVQAALGTDWFEARPVLRLIDVSAEDSTAASDAVACEIPVHGEGNDWYLNVPQPPRVYRVDLGYLTSQGRFFLVARSNRVEPPLPGTTERIAESWPTLTPNPPAPQTEGAGVLRLHRESLELPEALEERFHQPMHSGYLRDYGAGALSGNRNDRFFFHIEAELIVYGKTAANAHVTLSGEPIRLRSDGSFTVRYQLPEGRQILPAVAQTIDGLEERTVILALERNTKQLEPMVFDGQD